MEDNSTRKLSPLEKEFQKLNEELERKAYSVPATAFEDNSKLARDKRVARAMKDFFYFDRIYFPEEFHAQGYYKPGVLHKTMLEKSMHSGIHWFGTFRNLAKSTYLKKIRIWQLLSGKANIGAIMSETLKKSSKFIRSIETALSENERLKRDFGIKIDVLNDDMLRFICNTNKRPCYYLPYSLDSNARGDNVHIDRPDFMDFDDLETDRNNHNEVNTQKRLRKILEAYRSCREKASMIGLGNNLHPKCLFNRLKIALEKGELSGLINIYPFPAWSNEMTANTPYLGSVWQAKYPAKSESEMKEMVNPQNDVEWSEAQCDPVLKSGELFPRVYVKTYKTASLPTDAYGPAYCDPNMSLKGKGDTTAMAALLYSRSTDIYYVHKPKCMSYSNPNDLLLDFLKMFDPTKIRIMAMDGHVNQESTWTANIRNFVMLKGIPLPPIRFCRYNVDMISGHLSALYKEGKIRFPEEYLETEEGKEFMNQFHSFISKKENGLDDAPDVLICLYALGLELGMFIPNYVSGGNPYDVINVGFGGGF